jgi:hypothetical protein
MGITVAKMITKVLDKEPLSLLLLPPFITREEDVTAILPMNPPLNLS